MPGIVFCHHRRGQGEARFTKDESVPMGTCFLHMDAHTNYSLCKLREEGEERQFALDQRPNAASEHKNVVPNLPSYVFGRTVVPKRVD